MAILERETSSTSGTALWTVPLPMLRLTLECCASGGSAESRKREDLPNGREKIDNKWDGVNKAEEAEVTWIRLKNPRDRRLRLTLILSTFFASVTLNCEERSRYRTRISRVYILAKTLDSSSAVTVLMPSKLNSELDCHGLSSKRTLGWHLIAFTF